MKKGKGKAVSKIKGYWSRKTGKTRRVDIDG